MKQKILISFLLFTIVVAFSACSEDDPIAPAEEHFEAVGVVIKTSGISVATIFEGQTTDTLAVSRGQLSDAYDVYFLDENQEELDPPSDTEKTFTAIVSDTTIATFYQHEGEEGGYEFHLNPKKAGVTDVEFFILHAGHNDFRSGKMPVMVND